MKSLLEDLQKDFRGEILSQEPLSAHTSWKLGGPAELYLVPESRADLQLALRCVQRSRQPWMVIGNGTNLLVSDCGFSGVVIQLGQMDKLDFLPGGKVEVEAGVQLGQLITACCRWGFGGLEELSGIPGMVGGALMMNAGALETEIGDLVSQIYLTDGLGEWALRRDQINFSYRHSGLAGKGVISRAVLQLTEADPAELEKRRSEVLERRKAVQRVPGAHAGSVFKNPAGEKAWQLIDKAGLRGRRIGNAEVSTVHCNHIVNLGGASSADVMALIEEVQRGVSEISGRQLELEVCLVGWEEGQ
jgi:UDP-N-acetylmuramate dehydrogenase